MFYERVKQMTKLESSEGVLLGHAIAHELGHLLRSNAHARDGIMAGYRSAGELARIAKGLVTFRRTAGKNEEKCKRADC